MKSHMNVIDEARTMRDLVSVALTILREISDSGRISAVQVCGPISTGGFNNLDKNITVFKTGIRVLQERGFNVFDQSVFQGAIIRITNYHSSDVGYKKEILKDFFRDIFASEYVTTGFFIPNWRSSIGACWEHGLLEHLNIERIDMPKDWFYDIFW